MKASLRFDLSDEEDLVAFKIAVKSQALFFALEELREELRKRVKYASDTTPNEAVKASEEVQDFFWQTIQERNLGELFP